MRDRLDLETEKYVFSRLLKPVIAKRKIKFEFHKGAGTRLRQRVPRDDVLRIGPKLITRDLDWMHVVWPIYRLYLGE